MALTVGQAAGKLGIAVSTLKAHIGRGNVRSFLTPGGHHRICEEEIERLQTSSSAQLEDACPHRQLVAGLVAAFDGKLEEVEGELRSLRYPIPDLAPIRQSVVEAMTPEARKRAREGGVWVRSVAADFTWLNRLVITTVLEALREDEIAPDNPNIEGSDLNSGSLGADWAKLLLNPECYEARLALEVLLCTQRISPEEISRLMRRYWHVDIEDIAMGVFQAQAFNFDQVSWEAYLDTLNGRERRIKSEARGAPAHVALALLGVPSDEADLPGLFQRHMVLSLHRSEMETLRGNVDGAGKLFTMALQAERRWRDLSRRQMVAGR